MMMDALIAELEVVTEGSREVDAKIECSRRGFILGAAGAAYIYLAPNGWLAGPGTGEQPICAPHYTTSLDAALTLVPAGSHVSAQFDTPEPGSDTAASIVLSYGEKRLGGGGSITPALALCIAALRACQTMEDSA